jgi:riboflavin kinase / FMN adenylyltransferase
MFSAARIGCRGSWCPAIGVGGALGFPTANLQTMPHGAIPADGVYAGWLARLGSAGREEQRWAAAISVGTKPTFGGQERAVEAYVLDCDHLDLYGAHVAAGFAARIRRQLSFGSAAELVAEMHRDAEAARVMTGSKQARLPGPAVIAW